MKRRPFRIPLCSSPGNAQPPPLIEIRKAHPLDMFILNSHLLTDESFSTGNWISLPPTLPSTLTRSSSTLLLPFSPPLPRLLTLLSLLKLAKTCFLSTSLQFFSFPSARSLISLYGILVSLALPFSFASTRAHDPLPLSLHLPRNVRLRRKRHRRHQLQQQPSCSRSHFHPFSLLFQFNELNKTVQAEPPFSPPLSRSSSQQPLKAMNNLTVSKWFGNGLMDFPPAPGKFMEVSSLSLRETRFSDECSSNRVD